jgi:hypothetical protein
MAQVDYGMETDTIFANEPLEYSRNVMLAIVNQFYNPRKELFSVARDAFTDQLLGYTWAVRGERAPWSSEEMVSVRMAHVRRDLSARNRVKLVAQMLRMWEVWAAACEVKIICSSTVRGDQTAFLKLHAQAGYSVRGSICYKRLNTIVIPG